MDEKPYLTQYVHGCRRFRKFGDYWLSQFKVHPSKEKMDVACEHYAKRYPDAIVKVFKVRCHGRSWVYGIYWIHPEQMKQQDKERKGAESQMGDCYMCDKPAVFIAHDLPTGEKPFCSELHFCQYACLTYRGEGYYGFTDPAKVKEPARLARARKRIKYAETFEAESNGDKQLELAVKRTKMSMIRTGLAITTFSIVIWNLWTNKKQEKQIADIMGLV